MIIAGLPQDERLRLDNLKSFDVLGTGAEEDFNDLAALTAQFFNCPVALVTLIDETQQWFKGKIGTDLKSNQRNLSFCAHTILTQEVMVVEDAANDDRFFDNPMVSGEFKIRFYAGAPITSPEGYNLGTICMFDQVAKTFSATEKNTLILLAKQAGKLLELRKKNLLLRESAEEIIVQKTRLLNNVLKMQEEDNSSMAYILHEKLAQEVATGLLYLKTAEQDDANRRALINTAKKHLEHVLVDIKKLSNAIVPAMATFLPIQQLLAEYVKKIARVFSFMVTIKVEGDKQIANADLVKTGIHIIEEWFKLLAGDNSITKVVLTIRLNDYFEISIEDNALDLNISDRDKCVMESLLYERVMAQEGKVEVFTIKNGKNILTVSIPVMAKLPQSKKS